MPNIPNIFFLIYTCAVFVLETNAKNWSGTIYHQSTPLTSVSQEEYFVSALFPDPCQLIKLHHDALSRCFQSSSHLSSDGSLHMSRLHVWAVFTRAPSPVLTLMHKCIRVHLQILNVSWWSPNVLLLLKYWSFYFCIIDEDLHRFFSSKLRFFFPLVSEFVAARNLS